MAELVMLFGIGFFVAALLGLLIVLYVHNRFARLRSVDQSYADVHQLEQKLAVTLEERSKLEREIAAMKRDVELTWAAERMESALFRERISDVAHEVVRITQALESRGSSIQPISAYETLVMGHGRRTQTPDIDSTSGEATAPMVHTGALADRIRALRTTASRAAAN
jgi:lysine/ornithine N-monooxygenase